MPYLKPKPRPFDGMRRLLLGYELNAARLSTVLGCSEPTARSRLNNPGTLTVEELDKIRRFGHVPVEEIREKVLT